LIEVHHNEQNHFSVDLYPKQVWAPLDRGGVYCLPSILLLSPRSVRADIRGHENDYGQGRCRYQASCDRASSQFILGDQPTRRVLRSCTRWSACDLRIQHEFNTISQLPRRHGDRNDRPVNVPKDAARGRFFFRIFDYGCVTQPVRTTSPKCVRAAASF